nr:hypothetical protein 12ap_00092 [Serratia proteamaculans]ULG13871.1 hypothetical protein 12dp_00092 [Serratia proteamaculans]ULG14222.1 hypothetical protein 28Fp_00083 [Serratia proteamaculans]ULG15290.1 hypothetical protein 336p_00019 [Serratia proteamaculans]ULG16641.1 hypothetical protein 1769p_00023 [Serratia proteamaculans]
METGRCVMQLPGGVRLTPGPRSGSDAGGGHHVVEVRIDVSEQQQDIDAKAETHQNRENDDQGTLCCDGKDEDDGRFGVGRRPRQIARPAAGGGGFRARKEGGKAPPVSLIFRRRLARPE